MQQYKNLGKKPELLLKKTICEYYLGNTRSSTKYSNYIIKLRRKAFSNKLNAPVIAEIGGKNLYFLKDDILLFSSRKDTRYARINIYIEAVKNGSWKTPLNLGLYLNTIFDELYHFLSRGGKEFYYISDREGGFGGFDIFKSTHNGNNIKTLNLGMPINSPRIDIQLYFTNANSTQPIFIIDRINGIGICDLYLAYGKDQALNQLFSKESLSEFIHFQKEAPLTIKSIKLTNVSIPLDKRVFVCFDILYAREEDILAAQNSIKLQSLFTKNTLYPELNFDLIAYNNIDNLNSFDLFFGVKSDETINDQLVIKEFKNHRINVVSVGISYTQVTITNNNLANQLYNRIYIRHRDIEDVKIKIICQLTAVTKKLQAVDFELNFNSYNKTKYRIIDASTSQMLRGDILQLDEPFTIVPEEKKLRYYIGNFQPPKENKKFKQTIGTKLYEMEINQPFLYCNTLSTREAYKLNNRFKTFKS